MGAPRIKNPKEYIRSHTALFSEDEKDYPFVAGFSPVRDLYYAKRFNLSAYSPDSEEQAVDNLRAMIRNVHDFVDNAEFFSFFDKETKSFVFMAGQLVGKRKDRGGAILALRDQICRNAETLPSMMHIDTSDPALLRRIVFANPYPDFDGKIFLDEAASKLAGSKRYTMENGDLSTTGASKIEAARKFDFRIGKIHALLDNISLSFSEDQGVISVSATSPSLSADFSFSGKTRWEALFALGMFIKEEVFVAETERLDWESVKDGEDDGEVAGGMS